MKQFILMVFAAGLWACGGSGNSGGSTSEPAKPEVPSSIAEGKGIGEITEVRLNNPLIPDMVNRGKGIYEMKCAACHKSSAQRVVGPGFKGVTSRHKPEWIMNMITNVEIMLAEDPAAQALLKECLVRMPNQNLSIGDARDVLEWMQANDGKEVGEL